MTKYQDPSAKCLAMAYVPAPRFGADAEQTVICQKSVAHNEAKTKKARRHFDPNLDIYWTDEDVR